MKNTLLFSCFLFVCLVAQAQSDSTTLSNQKAIRAVIDQLFLGMKKGDSALVRASFLPNAQLATALLDKNNTPSIRSENNALNDFLTAVGTPHKKVWNEIINDVVIHSDGSIATVWAPYSFFLDDKFIHCGVNTFQLALTSNGWKIVNLLDSRRTTNCQ